MNRKMSDREIKQLRDNHNEVTPKLFDILIQSTDHPAERLMILQGLVVGILKHDCDSLLQRLIIHEALFRKSERRLLTSNSAREELQYLNPEEKGE